MEISKLYKPIFKNDNRNNKIVLQIIPIKLLYMDFFAYPQASRKEESGDSIEYNIKIGLRNRR